MSKKTLGLDDSTIINSLNKSNKKMEDFTVNRTEPIKTRRYTNVHIKVKGYSYNDFINDYKISIMENMFFPIRLMKRGIYDFCMRDRAIQAFETFLLN